MLGRELGPRPRREAAHEPAQAAAAALPRRADAGLRRADGRDRRAGRSRAGRPASPYKLRPRMQAITLEIILDTVFGVREGERLAELRDALRDFLDLTTNPRPSLPLLADRPRAGARLRPLPPPHRPRRRADLQRDRRAPRAEDLEERDDILSLLVGARHEDGAPMSDEEMRDELLTLLVAGHETTATALSWAVERLVRHPEKLERLRAEVAEGREEYLTATIQETLRLRPVISLVNRKLTEPVEIGGYELPAGRLGRALHLPRPPRPRDLSRARRLPARALPRQPARHLHLDPLRRRRPPLPRRRLRPVRDAGRPARAGQAPQDPPGRAEVRANLPPRDHRDPAPRRRGGPRLRAAPQRAS